MIAYPLGVGDVVTRVLEAGEGGPAVLLQHGFTSRADRWRQTAIDLAAQGYRVFAPDLPGHGFASKSGDFDHSVPGYRDFVLRLLDRLGLERVSLVGTSLGGFVLAAVAARIPERTAHLTMIGSMGLSPLTADHAAKVRAGLRDMSPAAMRARLISVFNDASLVTDDLVREDVRVNTSPGAAECLDRFASYLATGYNRDLVLDDLVALDGRVPLLLIWGEDDSSVAVADGHAARRRLPHARLAVLHGINHTPYIESPAAFQAILLDFLSGRNRQPPLPGVSYA